MTEWQQCEGTVAQSCQRPKSTVNFPLLARLARDWTAEIQVNSRDWWRNIDDGPTTTGTPSPVTDIHQQSCQSQRHVLCLQLNSLILL